MSTHEKYLDNIDGAEEREAPLYVYSEQFKIKHEFDCMIKSERERANPSQSMFSKSCRSASIRTGSSRISTLSKKRERLAIAQLRIDQIARKHEITKKCYNYSTRVSC